MQEEDFEPTQLSADIKFNLIEKTAKVMEKVVIIILMLVRYLTNFVFIQ